MFWENLISLCNKNKISPNGLCATLGLSTATATKWKTGAIPHNTTLKKIADYFGVTIDHLLGAETENTLTPEITLTDEEIEIIKELRRQAELKRPVKRMLGIDGTIAAFGGGIENDINTGDKNEDA